MNPGNSRLVPDFEGDLSIRVEHLSKCFRVYSRPFDRLREALSLKRTKRHIDFWALRDLTLQVRKGETVGVIGQNGSGKSTLLKVLARLMLPTSGLIQTRGRVSSLIELGTGFHPEFSGRSNVYMNASLMGLSDEEIDERFESIVEFSGLRDFIDRPLKTYSSGMWVRLAFSTAICVDPEILLVDEALSVGDLLFQNKCIRRLRRFQEEGTTIFFVSHDPSTVRSLCDRAIMMDEGRIQVDGLPAPITEHYIAFLAGKGSGDQLAFRSGSGTESEGKKLRRYGNFRAEIRQVELLNKESLATRTFISGDPFHLKLSVEFHEEMKNPTVGILIKDRLGNDVFGTNTLYHEAYFSAAAGDVYDVEFRMNANLGPGDYFLTVAVHTERDHLEDCRDWIDNVMEFRVLATRPEFVGVARLEAAVKVTPGTVLES